MATVPADVFTQLTTVRAGVLRNGAAANVARTARESAVAPKYHFQGIRHAAGHLGDPANFRTPLPVAVLTDAQFRCAFSRIVEQEVRDAEAAHDAAVAAAAGGGAAVAPAAFDAAAVRGAAAQSSVNRLEAIAVGAVHAALTYSYQIAEADLIATEARGAVLVVTAPAAAADDGAYATRAAEIAAGWNIALASGHTDNVATGDELVMLNAVGFTAVEGELAYALFSMGQASPVRAGAQLFVDGHHYHSDASASARCRAIEEEVVNQIGQDARALWMQNRQLFRNAVWHAAIHPISSDLLMQFAEDEDMVGRLDATGFGSMSVGLPAQEDLFNRAGSYLAVLNAVRQTAQAHGHAISLGNLEAAARTLHGLPRRGALPGQRPALPEQPAAAWPAGCDTRAKALHLFLVPYLEAAEPVAAWLFGYYKEITQAAGIRRNTREGSLLRSYSLQRAMANYLGEANRAQTMYAARARYARAQAAEGVLDTYVGSA